MKQQSNEATMELVEAIFNDKKYCEIKKPNKDIYIILKYANNCSVHFTYCYNPISDTYTGLQVNSFIDSVRGLLRICPDFFNDLCEHDYVRHFNKLGFDKTDPTETDILIFGR